MRLMFQLLKKLKLQEYHTLLIVLKIKLFTNYIINLPFTEKNYVLVKKTRKNQNIGLLIDIDWIIINNSLNINLKIPVITYNIASLKKNFVIIRNILEIYLIILYILIQS